jgi:predicted nucleotide-binding protein (sugar kinase/HSP70/actin superfamily)
MKEGYTILFPQMAPVHFGLIQKALAQEGYKCEALSNEGPGVVKCGLENVHNDACYPAILVIGQFIDALKSGAYDVNRTALLITQTGGGCRASNYVYLLRKALDRAGFGHVPVASLNFSGLDGKGFPLTLRFMRKALAAVAYGDLITTLYNQSKPYEAAEGESGAAKEACISSVGEAFAHGKGYSLRGMRGLSRAIVARFSAVKLKRAEKLKVGIVGEIYVKHSPFANNRLEKFLIENGCEPCVPWLLGFVQYCISGTPIRSQLYGGRFFASLGCKAVLSYTLKIEAALREALRDSSFEAPEGFNAVKAYASKYIGMGASMGEGWLLTGEMAELIHSGYKNIVCAQPFGCLPNHIVGKAMIAKIRASLPDANIMPIDYDPSQTTVNQENRIRLLIANANKGARPAFSQAKAEKAARA